MPDTLWTVLTAGAGALAVSALALAMLLRSGIASAALDRPNERSMHTRPTPRIGGLGILAGLAAAVVALRPEVPATVWIGLAIVCAVSVVDDLRGLSAALRLPLHLAAAGVAVAGVLPGGAAVAALAALAVAWMINLYNFMDGSNGLAGGQAVIGFGALAAAALAGGDVAIAVAAAAAAGGAAGFLPFNFPRARTFMGDAGSTTLGYLAGALGVLGVARGLWSPAFPLIAFLPFAFDATATLLLRAARGRRVWEAHREHAYQRLNMGGLGHLRTALLYWSLMAACATLALADRGDGTLVLAALLPALAWLYHLVQRSWSRRQTAPTPR